MKILDLCGLLLLPSVGAFVPVLRAGKETTFYASTLDQPKVETVQDVNDAVFFPEKKSNVKPAFRPGMEENSKFTCDSSVTFWQEFESEGDTQNLLKIQQIVSKHLESSTGRAYWLSHVLRTSYFTANALLGLLGHDLHENFVAKRDSGDYASRLQGFASLGVATRLLFEAAKVYEQDWNNVKRGLLTFPWDASVRSDVNGIRIQTDHKQTNPLFVLTETRRLVGEAIQIYGRQNRLQGKPSGVWVEDKSIYPSYYLNDFHYQTDGWMSTESAERYEVSTETLFLGRQDAMQRQTLVPLKKYFQDSAPKNLLEVACGTGRFATFARDNFRSTQMTLTDLSPYYLEKARKNDEYWRNHEKLKLPPSTFVQANAEKLPFADESFDAVTCVYLFHELPETARARAAAEMARVCKKGGMVVLTDSIQLGDRPPLDASIGGFENLNEPYYQNYLATDLPTLFEKHGMVCHEKYVASTTKTLSFIKR